MISTYDRKTYNYINNQNVPSHLLMSKQKFLHEMMVNHKQTIFYLILNYRNY